MAKASLRRIDVTGRRFGRLLALRDIGSCPRGRLWECLCDCGASIEAPAAALRSGSTQSCGCLKRDNTARLKYKHGGKGTPEFVVWSGMRARCLSPNFPQFKDYGARGIRICDRWMEFENFIADMGPRPSPAHTIERLNNDGPYSAVNCVWATRKQQCQNTRRNRLITWKGRTMTLGAWAAETGILRETIAARLDNGLPPEEALTRQVRTRPRRPAGCTCPRRRACTCR